MTYKQHNTREYNVLSSMLFLLLNTANILPILAGFILAIVLSTELLGLFLVMEAMNLTINWYKGNATLHYYLSFYAILILGMIIGTLIGILVHTTPFIILQ